MIRLHCPNCGPRNTEEFRYGGEYNPRPVDPTTMSDAEWADYVFMRRNRAGVQREWWLHRPCGLWFYAERDTRTNVVLSTYTWSPSGSGVSNER